MSIDIVNFGCRLNAYESDVIRNKAHAAGAQNAVILNTCAVTEEATRQARQAIRRVRREHPNARIVVTGCAAQIDPERFARMTEVDLVIGNEEKLHERAYRPLREGSRFEGESKTLVGDIASVRKAARLAPTSPSERVRAILQVQNGCDHRCTFCVIPQGRGNSRSVPADFVIETARTLTARGHAELIISGVDIASYGKDSPGEPTLGGLVSRLLRETPELKRLRISSIDSMEIDDLLLRAFAEEERLMPHLHLSLQSGDDLVLRRMKRRHSRRDAIRFCEDMRRLRPDIVFGADLIAGFPTETDDMFARSLAAVDECGLTFLHVFPFSPRPGTAAARMPQVDRAVVKARAADLRRKGRQALSRHLDAQRDVTHNLLLEKKDMGRTPHATPVALDKRETDRLAPGAIVKATITGRTDAALIGKLAV